MFPELGNDYRKIQRPVGKGDLLIGTNDVRLHPYLANPNEHLKGNLRLMTSMFGTGVLIDGSHPDVKAGPHRDHPEETGEEFEHRKPRGFKRRARTSHHSSVGNPKVQELRVQDIRSKGRPSGGSSFSDVSACSLVSAMTTYNQGSKGPRAGCHKDKRSQDVVFD